ncbi:cAMP-binding protein [Pseudomonas chlororaphis]|uniref:cAMP-binding protein n=1 Tax=Pseudomonas chlororaphis TaxID=587753 RepID=A0A3G7TY89_9PSED|nr:cAMP-binding protein [Pseudomonas chlororaphis]
MEVAPSKDPSSSLADSQLFLLESGQVQACVDEHQLLKPRVYKQSKRAFGGIRRNRKNLVDLEMRIVMITTTGREISR